jgi:beta-N-acetylhexosaminidase
MDLLTKISNNPKISKPVIYGLSSTALSDEEKYFFSKNGGVGFIIFSRNIENKIQLKKLTDSLREIMEGEVLILVDQEGGRVARLRGGQWPDYPSAEHFAKIYLQDQKLAKEELFKNFTAIAKDLTAVGINVDCAPVLDILTPKTHQIIGNRAYGSEPWQVSELGKIVCDALICSNVYPVIKHIPGHGRASSDSHLELPIVDASLEELEKSDFIPFKNLRDTKFAMTAHILYSKIDDKNPATSSSKMIEIIRNHIGFKNILMSDDISMKALNGSNQEKTKAILEAGCDLILHCNGIMKEMLEINSALPNLNDNFLTKLTD